MACCREINPDLLSRLARASIKLPLSIRGCQTGLLEHMQRDVMDGCGSNVLLRTYRSPAKECRGCLVRTSFVGAGDRW